LFANTDNDNYLSPEGVVETAVEIGLDEDAFDACVSSGKYASTIQDNISAAQEAGVSATPTFFINDVKLEGNNPLENFANYIDQAQQGS